MAVTLVSCLTPSTLFSFTAHGAEGSKWDPARAAFEERGYTVHAPTLRHHELPLHAGAGKIAPLSLRDYADDLVTLVASLDGPPLLVGHSLGGLLVQLVAARTHNAGMVAARPSAVGPAGLNPTTLRLSSLHGRQPRPWAKPVYPPTWKQFRRAAAYAQTEETARQVFDDLVCESGRVLFFELAVPWLDRTKAARADLPAITAPVLVIGGGADRIVPTRLARRSAARYENGSYAEIPASDHLVFHGNALSATIAHIDDWIARNDLVGTA